MKRGNRLKSLRIVMIALTGIICVRAFLLPSGSNAVWKVKDIVKYKNIKVIYT